MLSALYLLVRLTAQTAGTWVVLVASIALLANHITPQVPDIQPWVIPVLVLTFAISVEFVVMTNAVGDLDKRGQRNGFDRHEDRKLIVALVNTLAAGGKIEVVTRTDGQWIRLQDSTGTKEFRLK